MPAFSTKGSQALYLAIDQGGHASRVMVFDQCGNVVAQSISEVAVSRPESGWVEQDADLLEQSVRDALNDIAINLGASCQMINAAGLATQRSSIVCWNRKSGEALSPVISWQDRRAYQWMKAFDSYSSRIRYITGLLPSAHYGVSKLHWCLKHLPEVQNACENGALAWGPLSSFLLYRLLEEHPLLVDPVNASRTLLWDVKQGEWSKELLALFEIPGNYLPEGVANRHNFGKLIVGDASIPLTVSTGDQSAALFAFGKPEKGTAYINIGTGAFLQSVSDSPAELPGQLLQSVVWADANSVLFAAEATVNGAGSAVQLVGNELNILPQVIFDSFPEWLTKIENIPLYLNGVSGLGAPFWVPDFKSQFIGEGTVGQKMVAVIESIVFLLQINLEIVQQRGIVLDRIVVSGGLSVLDGLCQRLADLSGLQVYRSQQGEATAQGLAFLLAGCVLPYDSGEDTVKGKCFESIRNENLSRRYQRWQKELIAVLNN